MIYLIVYLLIGQLFAIWVAKLFNREGEDLDLGAAMMVVVAWPTLFLLPRGSEDDDS